jgi:type I restriction enzyme S subunit
LDAIQSLITKYNEQLNDYDNLAKSIFNEMFGDVVSNDKGWDFPPLSKFATLINGRAYSQKELLSSGKYIVLRVGNFFSDKDYYYSDLELDANKYCNKGDLIFAWSASFGAQIWNGPKVIYHYHIWKIELNNNADKNFVCYLLNQTIPALMSQTHGVGMMHLTKNGVEKTKFILPPLPLQQAFASRITAIESQKDKVKQQITDLQTLFDSRMQYYFD